MYAQYSESKHKINLLVLTRDTEELGKFLQRAWFFWFLKNSVTNSKLFLQQYTAM
jgi:hypothetical protein